MRDYRYRCALIVENGLREMIVNEDGPPEKNDKEIKLAR
jgi:hypothetical protein